MNHLRRHIDFSLMGRSLWTFQTRLCPTWSARLRLIGVYAILVVAAFAGRLGATRTRKLRIHAAGRDRDWWVGDPMEVAALWTVFVGGEYGDWLPASSPSVIVDAGANVGSASLWFRERFPEATVIAVEPNPTAFERLRRNLGHEPNVHLINAALGGQDGRATFALASATSLQGRLQEQPPGDAFEVDVISVATIRERYAAGGEIDLLKLNIEGAEWQVLGEPLTGVGTIVMEIHEPVPEERDPDGVLTEIADREGFELRQGYSQTLAPRKLRWLIPTHASEKEPRPVGAA